ncbi:unnamed protein product [Lupinus luteus]|uniref:Uncharacterized protein n=1 Tax=Lupinus luteus TaxID=3873 RepID=A0AAV1WU16_LUPLU
MPNPMFCTQKEILLQILLDTSHNVVVNKEHLLREVEADRNLQEFGIMIVFDAVHADSSEVWNKYTLGW